MEDQATLQSIYHKLLELEKRVNSIETKFDRSWNMTRPVLEKLSGEE